MNTRNEDDLCMHQFNLGTNQVFFLVLARTEKGVLEKIEELQQLNVPFVVVCGNILSDHRVIHRELKGKYDAINYGSDFLPEDKKIVCINDVDTRIFNFERTLEHFKNPEVGLVFCKVVVKEGPQQYFYPILDNLRRRFHVASSGELMLIRRNVLENILPLPPCKTEDNFISFKVLEMGYKVVFCEECWVETARTKTLPEETLYKKRTVTGIYQALCYTKPPMLTRIFYFLLPFFAPLLLVCGRRGFHWVKGIVAGLANFLSGDREGKF
jgi:cellulose synthase/poly-beta-1,6-N-acetylglucosamine synthase-like glycosyltransferase